MQSVIGTAAAVAAIAAVIISVYIVKATNAVNGFREDNTEYMRELISQVTRIADYLDTAINKMDDRIGR